jgi:ATP-binding cassette subfamily C (CFTR/MRP) protein 1
MFSFGFQIEAVILLLAGLILLAFQPPYRASNREIKRIETTQASPFNAHVSECLSGLTTLRAFNMGPWSIDMQQKLLNKSTVPALIMKFLNLWITSRIEVSKTCYSLCESYMLCPFLCAH